MLVEQPLDTLVVVHAPVHELDAYAGIERAQREQMEEGGHAGRGRDREPELDALLVGREARVRPRP